MRSLDNLVIKTFAVSLALTLYTFVLRAPVNAMIEARIGSVHPVLEYFLGLWIILLPTYIVVAILTRGGRRR